MIQSFCLNILLSVWKRGTMSQKTRGYIENALIIILMLVSGIIFCTTFFPAARLSLFLMHGLEMKRITERLFSLAFIIISYNLFQRRRSAWVITIAMLSAELLPHIIFAKAHMNIVLVIYYIFMITALVIFRKDFCCPPVHRSLIRSLGFMAAAVAAIFLNAGVGYHFMKMNISGEPDKVIFIYSLNECLGILFGTTNNNAAGFPNVRFENFIFYFTWGCMIIALLYALEPYIERHIWTERNMQHARGLVLKYGQNPASYLTLEDDKYLYFSRCAEGVIPYGIVGSTVIVNGDPVCAPENFAAVLAEFKDFCVRSSHMIVFLSITDAYLDCYISSGFGTVKCGEEARFDLNSYDIAGKKGAKMRMNINHATNSGLTVKEYRPLEQRDPDIEKAFEKITEEWLADKKSSMLTFTMGSVGLDCPMDRRYFYAADDRGNIKGFNVFCPFACNSGFMADITRRTHDAPGGITEKINYEAFMKFRDEGYRYASLGLAPLANLCRQQDESSMMEKILNFVYEHLNSCYGFKNLYKTKASYSPTEWLPGYYAYLPKVPVPSMMYAMVRIQNKKGIMDFLNIKRKK